MLRFLLVTMIAAMLLGSCTSAEKSVDTEKVKGELVALDRRLIAAVQRKDVAALNEIWDDQYFGTAPNGATFTKKDLIAAVQEGVFVIDSFEPDDLYVRVFDNVAVITGKAAVVARVMDEEFRLEVRGTGIFVKRNGKWKIAGVHVGPNRPDEPLKPDTVK